MDDMIKKIEEQRDRQIESIRMSGDVAIGKIESQIEEKIESARKQNDYYIGKIKWLESLRGRGLDRKKIEEAMSVLCFSSPAFCCGIDNDPQGRPGKPCPFRDSFWDTLGLGRDGYIEYKERCDELFWQFLNEKGVVGGGK